jgi:hypothetical protein
MRIKFCVPWVSGLVQCLLLLLVLVSARVCSLSEVVVADAGELAHLLELAGD